MSQNPCWNPSWLSDVCTTRKDPESEWSCRDNLETSNITMKPETANHMAEQSSEFPLPCFSPPTCPFPIKSLAWLAGMSSRTIHFQMLDKSPLSAPRKSLPSCNQFTSRSCLSFESQDTTDTIRYTEILKKINQASQIQDSFNYIIWNEFKRDFSLGHFPPISFCLTTHGWQKVQEFLPGMKILPVPLFSGL